VLGDPGATRYFSDTPHDKTVLGIEAVVEWIEAQHRPFTTGEAFHGSQLASYDGQNPSFSTAYRTIRDLEHYGLIRRVNARNAKPARWLPIGEQDALDA